MRASGQNLLILLLAMAPLAATANEAPETCPVTRPEQAPFAAPNRGPLRAGLFWYGSDQLWTRLPANGVWHKLPVGDAGYRQKSFWFRLGYDWQQEPQPDLKLSGRRIDGPSKPMLASSATNGYGIDLRSFMLVGIEIPLGGCWEITASYDGNSVTHVIWVTSD